MIVTHERNALADESFYPVVEQFEIPDSTGNLIAFDLTTDLPDWINKHFS